MDLLFKRYASPFLLLDRYIEQGNLYEFIKELIEIHNEDEMYKLWLLKVHDKSYQEFTDEIKANQEQEFKPGQIETTINNSKDILNNFNPNE